MVRRYALLAVLAAGMPSSARAQSVRFGLHVASVNLTEVNKGNAAGGGGVGVMLGAAYGKFTVELRGLSANVGPDSGAQFKVVQGDLRVGYALMPALSLEVGTGRRTVTPAFAAEDVGLARLGLRTELTLPRHASVWASGAYLLAPHYSGGGGSGLSLELGLGAGIGTADGRLRLRADYEFQRLDRNVSGVALPIQLGVARIGVEIRQRFGSPAGS